MKAIPEGLTRRFDSAVDDGDTAAALGNPGVAVVSTVALILKIEEACYHLVLPYYESDDATVGTRVAVDHLAPARPGAPIAVTATLSGRRGRHLLFEVLVEQAGKTVMRGQHNRAVVSLEQFVGGPASAPDAAVPEVEFWFDFHSPWCYLAAQRIGDLLRRQGGTLRWRPVHLANLMEAIDGRRPLEANPAFVRWYRQDIVDQAARLGLPYRPHPAYPLRPSRALRAALFAAEAGAAELFVTALMRGYWAEERDISDTAVLQTVAEAAGLDPARIPAVVSEPAYKDRLDANLQEAVAKGLFGLPALIFEGKLYWGNDHLDQLEQDIAAWHGAAGRQEEIPRP